MTPQEKLEALKRIGKMPKDEDMWQTLVIYGKHGHGFSSMSLHSKRKEGEK